MILYISGPISGKPNKNQEAFAELGKLVDALGHHSVTPFDLDRVYPREHLSWVDNMKRDLIFLPTVDGVVVMDDWLDSKGANIEVFVAVILDIPIFKIGADGNLEPIYVDADLDLTILTANEANPEWENN